jgi:hypothetical protein
MEKEYNRKSKFVEKKKRKKLQEKTDQDMREMQSNNGYTSQSGQGNAETQKQTIRWSPPIPPLKGFKNCFTEEPD